MCDEKIQLKIWHNAQYWLHNILNKNWIFYLNKFLFLLHKNFCMYIIKKIKNEVCRWKILKCNRKWNEDKD